jgi:3-hydroxyisobutyrate dehydrogenase
VGEDVTVAVLGTGIMGAGMVQSLRRAGHAVRVWNRTKGKAEALSQDGTVVAGTPDDAVREVDVVVTMLPDGRVTESVMEPVLHDIADRAVWAQMGTVGVEATTRLATLAGAAGVGFVDAPVLGTRKPAEQGELLVLAAGPAGLRERVAPVFDAVGRGTVWLGEEPGRASRLKLVVNHWMLGLVANLAESLALARMLEIDAAEFLDTIEVTGFKTPYAQSKGMAMVKGDYGSGFPVRLARKDLELAVEAAGAAGADLPLARTVAILFARSIELGHGDEDMSAVYRALGPPTQ